MNEPQQREAERRRRYGLALMSRYTWVTIDYLCHRLCCTRHQGRCDFDTFKEQGYAELAFLMDIRKCSEEKQRSGAPAKVRIAKLTAAGRKAAKRLPDWIAQRIKKRRPVDWEMSNGCEAG